MMWQVVSRSCPPSVGFLIFPRHGQANPDTIPTLEYLSLKGKAPYLKRDGQTTYLPPNSVQTLQDGDIISPISGCELKYAPHSLTPLH